MGKIEIKGAIVSDGDKWVYDWLEIPATCPNDVNKALEKMKDNEEVGVVINSGGGSVFAGSEIYTSLKSYKGNVIGRIVGIAASAASVIAMGVKQLEISPTAQIMMHRASTLGFGNKDDFEHTADVLSGIDESIANAYQIKTGLPTNELLNMMSKETWLTAQKAKELGFADSIMFESETVVVNSDAENGVMLPESVINKIRNELKGKPQEQKDENDKDVERNQLAKARLNLMIQL